MFLLVMGASSTDLGLDPCGPLECNGLLTFTARPMGPTKMQTNREGLCTPRMLRERKGWKVGPSARPQTIFSFLRGHWLALNYIGNVTLAQESVNFGAKMVCKLGHF